MTKEEKRAYDRQRYLQNREARLAAQNIYNHEYRAKGTRKPRKTGNNKSEYARRYYREHNEAICERQRLYYWLHREEILQRRRDKGFQTVVMR